MLGPSNDSYMKKVWTIRLALALIVAGVLDLVSTYIGTPDLLLEGNPILIMFGRKWVYVVAFKLIGSLVAVVFFAVGLRILQRRVDRLVGITGFVNVLSHLIFKRRISLRELLFCKCATDWPPAFAVAAIVNGVAIVTGGLIASILNTFAPPESKTQLIAYAMGSSALVLTTALWLTYEFLVKQRKTV
jgi:hypothetical protein